MMFEGRIIGVLGARDDEVDNIIHKLCQVDLGSNRRFFASLAVITQPWPGYIEEA